MNDAVMGEPRLLAKNRIIAVVEGGVPVFARLTCPAGHVYVVTAAYGFHADATARDCSFICTKAAAVYQTLPVNMAANLQRYLYTDMPSQGPLILREGHTLDYNATLKDNGDNVVLVVMVDEYVGESLYLD